MGKNKISVYIMGKEHRVPEGLTIMKALEYAGYRLIRGCGCRAGFCGACATIYRKKGDYKLYTALACQTTAENGMYLTQIPFIPANKSEYNLDEIQAGPNTMMVFPAKEGGFTVRFVFEKAADVQTGETISLVSAAVILVLVVFGFLRRAWVIPEGWAKTHHTGSGLGELER